MSGICWTIQVEEHLKQKLTAEEAFAWIILQYRKGRSYNDLAKDLKVSGQSIGNLIRALGINHRPRGGCNHKSKHKLTPEELKMCVKDLSKLKNVSHSTARLWKKKGETACV